MANAVTCAEKFSSLQKHFGRKILRKTLSVNASKDNLAVAERFDESAHARKRLGLKSSVAMHLAATGLRVWKIDGVARPPQHADRGNPYLWIQRVVVARDRQRDSHEEFNSYSGAAAQRSSSYSSATGGPFNAKTVFAAFIGRRTRSQTMLGRKCGFTPGETASYLSTPTCFTGQGIIETHEIAGYKE